MCCSLLQASFFDMGKMMNNHSSSAPLVHREGLKREVVSLTLECYSQPYYVQQIQIQAASNNCSLY